MILSLLCCIVVPGGLRVFFPDQDQDGGNGCAEKRQHDQLDRLEDSLVGVRIAAEADIEQTFDRKRRGIAGRIGDSHIEVAGDEVAVYIPDDLAVATYRRQGRWMDEQPVAVLL